MGGEAHIGVENCQGPCDLRAIVSGRANYDSPEKPAAVYSRGQNATVKYERNSHGPGGFIRLTIVPVEEMMDKAAHARNAFHYSCWGANPVIAEPEEIEIDEYGFNIIGTDGKYHNFTKGYYAVNITIPPCIPDGNYVLGWVYYGGTGTVMSGNEPQAASLFGYFGDYWSCSYIRVEGGVDVAAECAPVFVNDQAQFFADGCASAHDAPGGCSLEPCHVIGEVQKPSPFKNGSIPTPLTPTHFEGWPQSG